MEFHELVGVALASIVTGFISAWASSQIVIAKLSVHVDHHREKLREHDDNFRRIHQRLDDDAACRFVPPRGSNDAGR